MEKFILIDGNAIIHRAYHALPALNAPDGVMVNAVYGFFAMFLKILSEQQPDYVAIAFDQAAPTFRKTMYVGYQANRPSGPSELGPQFGLIREVVEKMNIPIFAVSGYEADDVIGTLAAQLTDHIHTNGEDIEVIIVTGDRDLMQLVNPHIKLLMPLTGITKMALYGEVEVEEKFGVKPSQIVDYKALIGDASDNYPGVSGIGPKTAAQLLKEHVTLEKLYEDLWELPEKIGRKLAEGAEDAGLAKKLATIVTDAPVTIDVEKCRRENINWDQAREEFSKYGFNSLIQRIGNPNA